MVKVPIESFDACDDFIVLVVECLIVAAAMKMLGMSEMHEIPTTNYAPKGTDTWMEPECERGKVLNHIIDDFMKTFFSFTYNSSASDPQSSSSRQDDRIYLYAKQALSFGLFYLEFRDAIKEGDGDRVLRCYRYMLPIFQNSGRKNYANETLNFLLNYDYILSKRQAMEFIWTRFINVHGCPGKNIPNDLHCEHQIRICKSAVKSLGANKTPQCIQRVAEALGTISAVMDTFDADNKISDSGSSAHNVPNSRADMNIILKELQEMSIFTEITGRYYPSFPNPRNILHAKPSAVIIDWIQGHVKF